jgi:hypothetical protein
VIDTVRKDFPLNVMYWAVRDDGGLSDRRPAADDRRSCRTSMVTFSIEGMLFPQSPGRPAGADSQYKLMVYFCSGTDSEKLQWFRRSTSPARS